MWPQSSSWHSLPLASSHHRGVIPRSRRNSPSEVSLTARSRGRSRRPSRTSSALATVVNVSMVEKKKEISAKNLS
jgi:hypothetical protein